MALNRTALIGACACVLSLLLVACPKKGGDAADGASDATPVTTATATADTVVDAGAATTATPLPGTWKPPVGKTDGGAGDAGAVAAVDAGGGATGSECCCEITGQPLANMNQSECTTTKKGQCVKKERCAGAGIDAGEQTCCCSAGGKKEMAGQSDCTKTRKGTCVKKTECK